MKNSFYLACYRDNFGQKVVFHRKGFKGYTTDISDAEILTREQAQKRWDNGRDFDIPLSVSHVQEKANLYVDMQKVPRKSFFDCSDEYVAMRESTYQGNDVCFVLKNRYSFIYKNVSTFSKKQAKEVQHLGWIFVPKHMCDSKARYAIREDNVNFRTFTQGAGIKKPLHAKRAARKVTGKERFNCPVCGKINWQHSPYDLVSCSDNYCKYNRK